MKNRISFLFIALLLPALFVTGCTTQPLPTTDPAVPLLVTGTPSATNQSEQEPIPEISNGSLPDPDYDDQKTLGMRVHSAVQMKTIPGMNLRQDARIAIINVSITNYAGSDVTIPREQLFIQTERSTTLEHGGDRVTREMARQYLRFPLVIRPGETITGPVLYVIHSGTRTNTLVLMDRNGVIQSMVDLNPLYQYK